MSKRNQFGGPGSPNDDVDSAFGWINDRPSDSNSPKADPSKPAQPKQSISREKGSLELLLEMNRRMGSITDLQELLVSILDDIVQYTGADRGVIFLYEDLDALLEAEDTRFAQPMLSIRVARDNQEQNLPTTGLKLSHSIVQEVAQNGEAVYLLDSNSESEHATRQSVVNLKLTTVMCSPLMALGRLAQLQAQPESAAAPKNRVIGVIYVDSKRPGVINEQDLEVFRAIAANAALAIENAWINNKLHTSLAQVSRTNSRLQALQQVSNAISSTLILDELLELIVDKSILLCRAQRGCLVLQNESGKPEFRTARTFNAKNIPLASLKVSNSTVHRSCRYGEVVVINDLNQQKISPDVNQRNSIFDLQLKAVICVPLVLPKFSELGDEGDTRSAHRIIGCLYVDSNMMIHNFTQEETETLQTFAQQAAIAIQNAKLYEEIEQQLFETVSALAATIDAKDPYTHGHSYRVAKFSLLIAEEMNFTKGQLKRLQLAGLLHDIGKVGVPDAVLGKPDKLTDDEFAQMKLHPVHGRSILGNVRKMVDLLGAMEHHEKVDGTGYPDGKRGDQISMMGRIISVADAFDAMTSDRVYRRGLAIDHALGELRKKSGTQFDGTCVEAFLRAHAKNKVRPLVNYTPDSPVKGLLSMSPSDVTPLTVPLE